MGEAIEPRILVPRPFHRYRHSICETRRNSTERITMPKRLQGYPPLLSFPIRFGSPLFGLPGSGSKLNH